MNPIQFTLCDGSLVTLNPQSDPELEIYLHVPRAQVPEMIRQINAANYYQELFSGREKLTFLDLGANLGLVSLYAAPACQRVIALEPEPYTFRMLEKLAKPWPVIECRALALAAFTHVVKLAVDKTDFSCHTLTNPKPGSPFVEVAGVTFDYILEHANLKQVDVCKVDVEGAEMESLSEDVLRSAPVKTWYLEIHRTPGRTREQNVAEMIARLVRCGYTLTTPRPNAIVAHAAAH